MHPAGACAPAADPSTGRDANMRKTPKPIRPQAARHVTTIGELERLAGVGASHEERFAFWRQFAHVGEGAFEAARDELYRRIDARFVGCARLGGD